MTPAETQFVSDRLRELARTLENHVSAHAIFTPGEDIKTVARELDAIAEVVPARLHVPPKHASRELSWGEQLKRVRVAA